MKQGRNIQDLAQEIMRQSRAKRDFTASTAVLEIDVPDPNAMQIRVGNFGSFGVTDLAMDHIGGRLNIPMKHFRRLYADHPDLLTHTVNELFRREPSANLVRTLDGNMRAMMSDRYRPLDNDLLAETILPILADSNGFRVASAEITDKRLYIKALFPEVEGEVGVGDVVQAGVVISNSEVGAGAVKVEPMIYRLVCTNGMIMQDSSMRKLHIGGTGTALGDDSAREFWRDETRKLSDAAVLAQVGDTVRAVAKNEGFEQMLETFRATTERKIVKPIPDVVEVVSNRLDLQMTERESVLDHLIRGGDLSQWGLANAVTRTAQDVASYDRATEIERLGSAVIGISDTLWNQIAVNN